MTGGSVYIDAGEAITAQDSSIEALAGNVNLTAGTITLAAGVDSFTTYAIHTEKFVGLNVFVEAGGANPLSAVQNGTGCLSAAEKTQDRQAKLLYEAAAGARGTRLLNVCKAETGGGLAQAFASFDIKVGIGVAVSSSESAYHTEQASGGMVLAAKSAVLNATAGDLTLTGATVQAPSVTDFAATSQSVLVEAAQEVWPISHMMNENFACLCSGMARSTNFRTCSNFSGSQRRSRHAGGLARFSLGIACCSW